MESYTLFGFLADVCGVFESLCSFFGLFMLTLTHQSFLAELAEKAF